jgi:hypothetical protein
MKLSSKIVTYAIEVSEEEKVVIEGILNDKVKTALATPIETALHDFFTSL